MYKVYEEYLETLHKGGKYRRLGQLRQESDSQYLDFSTNDYLNLSQNEAVIEAGVFAAKSYGMGSTGSRLLSGNYPLYEAFEATIARDKHVESSLIFSSGFQANISTLSCLLNNPILKKKPLVFFDKANHSSLYQAIFLTQAELKRYRHNDINHLESLLNQYRYDNREKFIVTETVFGMDGDRAKLADILVLAQQFNALLYLDEAHATGIFGVEGYGLSTTLDLQSIPHLIMGTFSKAIGVSGGYIATHQILSHFILNKATGFVYSTAPSPAVVGAAFQAWQQVRSLDHAREMLQNLGEYLRQRLSQEGLNIGGSDTHIIPVILHQEDTCLKVQKALLAQGIIVSCIRPPTVPAGTSRLRVALTTKHTYDDIERFVETLMQVLRS